MKKRTTTFILAAAAGSLAFSGAAQAASVTDLLLSNPSEETDLVVDDNAEYLIDRDYNGTPDPQPGSNQGEINIGDSLRGMLEITKINDRTVVAETGSELTGVFQAKVLTTPTTPGGPGFFTFGPDPTFAEGIGLPGSPAILFYEDASPDFSRTGAGDDRPTSSPGDPFEKDNDVSTSGFNFAEEALIDTATDGSLFWAYGFEGDQGEGFQTTNAIGNPSNPPTDVNGAGNSSSGDGAFGVGPGSDVGGAIIGLTKINGVGTGPEVLPIDTHPALGSGDVDLRASTDITGVNGIETPFEILSQTDIGLRAVPTPSATLASLLMISTLGTMQGLRRRRSA